MRRQAGVIAAAQAFQHGLSRRQVQWFVETNEWVRICPTVYRLSAIPPSPESLLWAGSLWLGDGARLTGLGAAWWWNLSPQMPDQWEFATICGTHLKRQDGVKVARVFVDPYDRVVRRDLGVVSRGLAALRGAVVLEKRSPGSGVAMIDRAKQRGLINYPELDRAFARNRGTWGTTVMRHVLEQVGGRASSELERRAVRTLSSAGVTGFKINYRTRLSSGRLVEFDIAFPDLKLAIELDGFAFHSSPEQLRADHRRQREVMDDGWTVRRFTWADVVDDPAGFIRAITALLP